MEPHTAATPGLIEQLLLPVFVLICFVGIAGGNPSMVLTPVFEIAGRLAMMAINLAICAIGAACKIGAGVIASWIGNYSAKRATTSRAKADTIKGKDNTITIKLK